MISLNTDSFPASIESGTWVVDFYADWCQPCKVLAPLLDSLEDKIPETNFAKVDVDDSSELANTYKISSVPTILFFKDGNLVDRHIGLISEQDIKSKIESI